MNFFFVGICSKMYLIVEKCLSQSCSCAEKLTSKSFTVRLDPSNQSVE